MTTNPLVKLHALGQSIWLDFIRRGMLDSGELKRLIEEDHVRGVTSNPAIFEKAIGETHDYDEAIHRLACQGKSVNRIYEELTVDDVQRTADLFRPIYDREAGRDGFVSLEVSPRLARDTEGTLAEARRLWAAVDRPNVLIKVPGTAEGLPAIRQLIGEGVNVNVTLLFGLPRYRQVADAYIAGLEDRLAQDRPIDRIASVASFFLSRIDVLVDPLLEKLIQEGGPPAPIAEHLRGEVAIACAKIAHEMHRHIFGRERFSHLEERGARVQRLVWASTGTKNPAYSDVKYIEPLIGPQTVNTIPLKTLNAYRDHGNPELRLEQGTEDARRVLEDLLRLGIDIDLLTLQLEEEGVEKFVKPYDRLIKTLEKARLACLGKPD
jgi:transaldolase